jgi:hypothetical protein
VVRLVSVVYALDLARTPCLNTQFELRDRQWQALEFLLYVRTAPEAPLPAAPATPPGRGSATGARGGSEPEPMIRLPRAHVVAVAELALGWQ